MSAENKPRLCRVAGRETWHIYHEGRRRSAGCTDRTEAEQVLARFIAELEKPRSALVGVAALLESYIADKRESNPRRADKLGWMAKPLNNWFGAKPPEAITASDVRAYTQHRIAQGKSPSTVRSEVQALSAALKWAVKADIAASAPAIPLPSAAPPKDRWLTRDEAQALADSCELRHLKLFVVLALNTGARTGALLDLTWDRVDLARGVIDLRDPTKSRTSKGRARVPINSSLMAPLKEAHAERGTPYVIEWGGRRVLSVRKGFQSAATRAGLRDVSPHTLRHTAATWMAQAGVAMWEIAGILGHSSTRMVEAVYAHHSPDYLRAAADALSGKTGERSFVRLEQEPEILT